jgi:cupin 2 domain-containing protein
MHIKHLFDDITPPQTGERFDTLLQQPGLMIERIVSSPRITRQVYLQEHDEWVLLLQGSAEMDIAGQLLSLRAGDYVFIPRHTPHRVISVENGAVWLAIHWQANPPQKP